MLETDKCQENPQDRGGDESQDGDGTGPQEKAQGQKKAADDNTGPSGASAEAVVSGESPSPMAHRHSPYHPRGQIGQSDGGGKSPDGYSPRLDRKSVV